MIDLLKLKIKAKTMVRVIIFILIITIIKFEPLKVHFNESINYVRNLNNSEVFLYLILGFLSVMMTIFYDLVWFRLNKRKIKFKNIVKASAISNIINNLVGSVGVTGIVIRRLFYKDKEISSDDIDKMNLLLLPSFFTGLSVIMVISFLFTMFYGTAFKSMAVFNILAFLAGFYLIIYLVNIFLLKYSKRK